jgi:hypothetical protein
MEYVASISSSGLNGGPISSPPFTYEVLSPAGATADAGGNIHYSIPKSVASGTLIDFSVRVSQLGATSETSWQIKAVRSLLSNFESPEELAANFEIYAGDGTAQFLPDVTLETGPLHVVLPGPGNPSFDNWCGFDRTPRLREKIHAFSTFDLETHLLLDPSNFPASGEHHVGLAIDRGFADLEIFGIYTNRVLRERNCNVDGGNGGDIFDPSFATPGLTVFLRIEKRGNNIKYFAKRDTDADYTLSRELNGARTKPVAAGLAVKTWGSEKATGVIVEYLQYGVPGDCADKATVSALVVTGPAGNLPGNYTATATATAPGIDPIYYTFTATKGAENVSVGPQTASSAVLALTEGTWSVKVDAYVDPDCGISSKTTEVVVNPPVTATWKLCDASGDGALDITDPIDMIGYLFTGQFPNPKCVLALDCDSNGSLDINDPVFHLNYQFQNGPKPADPYPECANLPPPGCVYDGSEFATGSCN